MTIFDNANSKKESPQSTQELAISTALELARNAAEFGKLLALNLSTVVDHLNHHSASPKI